MNTANFYINDNSSNRESIRVLRRDFCPTYEDFLHMKKHEDDRSEETCSMGFTLEQHNVKIDDKKESKIVKDISSKIEKKVA